MRGLQSAYFSNRAYSVPLQNHETESDQTESVAKASGKQSIESNSTYSQYGGWCGRVHATLA